ncbi:MAG: hypothetical protein M5U09_28040 [Gammaproteobacteria bacterium]|nr:hypothetical protein [Gammaproteobacteria bacterium]
MPKDWLYMTGVELIECLFENEQIKVGMLSYPATSGLDVISSRFTGPLAVLHFLTMFTVDGGYTARGGSHDLVHSLVRCFVHHGGKIYYNCPVERVLIESGEAKGDRPVEARLLSRGCVQGLKGGHQRPQRQADFPEPDR